MKDALKMLGFVVVAVTVLMVYGCEKKDGESTSYEQTTKACPADCTKPCCAAKSSDEVKACPPDCTKPCCAAPKACPADCNKPCCGGKIER